MKERRDAVSTPLIESANLQGYFHQALQDHARDRGVVAQDATLHYLTQLLTDYAKPDRLFDHTEDGLRLRPLALIYGDAAAASSMRERALWLRRLGDLALFVSALFADRVQRTLVDLDYYAAMGGGAYSYLRDTDREYPGHAALREIFDELAQRFRDFVGLLSGMDQRQHGPLVFARAQGPWLREEAQQLGELSNDLRGGRRRCH